MLSGLGLPTDLEGIVCIQTFTTARKYAQGASLALRCSDTDDARLHFGPSPIDHAQLHAVQAAQRQSVLTGFAKYEEQLASIVEEGVRLPWVSDPTVLLVGWCRRRVGRRSPLAEWDWVDLLAEWDDGSEAAGIVHEALAREAAALRLRFPDLIGRQVSGDAFWLAPGEPPAVVLGQLQAGGADLIVLSTGGPPEQELDEWVTLMRAVPTEIWEVLETVLGLLAQAHSSAGWLRFTLGWAALERLAGEFGKLFDTDVEVQQRTCGACGEPVTERRPGMKQRVVALARRLPLDSTEEFERELARLNRLRGATHGGTLPAPEDAAGPERLAGQLVHAIIENPECIAANASASS